MAFHLPRSHPPYDADISKYPPGLGVSTKRSRVVIQIARPPWLHFRRIPRHNVIVSKAGSGTFTLTRSRRRTMSEKFSVKIQKYYGQKIPKREENHEQKSQPYIARADTAAVNKTKLEEI